MVKLSNKKKKILADELWKDVNGSLDLVYDVQPNSQASVEILNDIGKVCFFVKAFEQDVNAINRQ